jgi:2-hydroxychromene-2-carboxylate isomerase
MTERTLSFYFDYISPYSYLGWHRLQAFAPEHGLVVELKPTLFAALLNHFGHIGPGEIPVKQRYIFKDCTRAAALLGVPFEPPASHPFNPLPSLRATLLDMDPETRTRLVTRLYAATWAESRDVGSPDVVSELASEVGVPDVLTRIQDPAIKKKLLDLGAEAIELGVFGVPSMVVDGEVFWGTDSFPHLERFLAGEDPVRPEDADRWASVKPSAKR